MQIFEFKSLPRETPFAPEWHYVLGESYINFVDFKIIAKLVLEKENKIIESASPINSINYDGYTGLGNSSLTSRYGTYNLFDWKDQNILQLKEEIRINHSKFLNILGIPEQKVYIQAWANVLRTGEYIKPHIHSVNPQTYLGGHISIQCYNTSTVYINPVNQINDPEIYESMNEVGKFTIFQNCIPHYTTKHDRDVERITIAFDLMYDKRHENCVELN